MNFRNIACLVVILFLLSGCQTSSKTKTNSIGANNSPNIESTFDKEKAAQNRLNAGLQYLRQGSFQNAKRHLDKALEYGADTANVHFGLGYYFEQVKEFAKARKSYLKALKKEPKNPDFLNGYAAFLCAQKDFKGADAYYNKAVNIPIYADVAAAYENAGICALRAEKVDKAAAYFRKALNRNKKLPRALLEMAQIEFDKGRLQRAYRYLIRHEAVSRPSAASLWLGVRISHQMQNKDATASYANKLEQLYPDSDETASYLDNKNSLQ